MSDYRVEFSPQAADESRGIPPEAFIALMAALGDVARDPWNASHSQGRDVPHERVALFNEAGMALVYIDVEAHVVRVHTITWAG